MALEADQVLNNRYRIIKLLGEGGFGEVYQAWDMRLEAFCAVKRNMQLAPEVRRQFEQEARLLFKLIHPNLPRVHDYFRGDEDDQYLVMDFVEGENLREYLRESGPPPLEQALEWIDQVSDALNYLHRRQPPIVHRDIKPANIILTPDDKAMLVDFGIAKADPQLRTLSGARAWTPGYAPPEQYGQGRTDARSDVYSLAATAYALLTGESPPDAMDVAAGSMKPASPAHEINPAVPVHVSRAIGKAMLFNREQRTSSVEEFRQALKRRTKAAAGKVLILETQKTIMEPRPEVPAAFVEEKPLIEEKPSPPSQTLPIEKHLVEEGLKTPEQSQPIDVSLEEQEDRASLPPPIIEEPQEVEEPKTLVQTLAVEEHLIEEEPQAPVQSGPSEELQVEPVPNPPVQSWPTAETPVEAGLQPSARVLPASRPTAWQRLGWKGIAGLVGIAVVLIIIIGLLWNRTDPQEDQKIADLATWAALTQEFQENKAGLPGEGANATLVVAETATAFSTPTATVEARMPAVESEQTATVQTLSRFREARTATALSATGTAQGEQATLTATPTARSTLRPTLTPTATKKPKKRDDSQITLEPGITLVP